jgi:hypothetical protein
MKRTVPLLLFVVFALGIVLGQQATTGSPATKEDVEKLFATMHIREQMRSMMEVMSKQSRQMAQDSLKKKVPELTEKDLERLDQMMDRIQKQLDFDAMIDDMIPVYQRHLTKEDIAAMEAFYETPTGQKMLREQPEMTAEGMRAVQPRMEKMMSSLMDEAEKIAKEAGTGPKPANTNTDKN